MNRRRLPTAPRLGPLPAPTDTAVEIATDARLALGRVRQAWAWLGDARAPGKPGPPPTRPISPARLAAEAAARHADRTAQLAAARAGIKPGAAQSAPARAVILDARNRVVAELGDLGNRMWMAMYAAGLVMLVRDPGDRFAWAPCTWCRDGILEPPTGWTWEWSPDPVACPRCRGRGRVPAADLCQACGSLGPCTCDRSDAAVALHIATIAELLDLADVELAADADATLTDLADDAERILGLGRDMRRLPGAECPTCGCRELVADVGSPDRREWSVTCYGPTCRCEGPGCPCGIGTPRRRDRRHRWPARTWDSRDGLAARAGTPPAEPRRWRRITDTPAPPTTAAPYGPPPPTTEGP